MCATKEAASDPEFNLPRFEDFERTSDAIFKCPAYEKEGSCKSEEVIFRVFFLGTCCEPASKVLVENEKGKSMLFLITD